MKFLFSASLSCIISLVSLAQRTNVQGVLKDSASFNPISFANITNITTGKTVITNPQGLFSIEVKEYDILSFSYVGYHFDTIHYTGEYLTRQPLVLTLSPLVNTLDAVTVTTKGYSRYQIDSIERRKEFLAAVGSNKMPAVSGANSGAGIGLNLDRFKKKEKNKRQAFIFFDENEQEQYINYRFSNTIVNRYTGLQGDSLQLFMQNYRPDFTWLRQNTTEEDVKYYINDRLKSFFKRED
ncbi:carboxypeptidase-like regulatory domain-containing protein [Foetidibacter luteolus]|uniref:carboxypeptidase-like regulatory domain-containing protein n=1 Tax=Foetidibacter luteolus TaxID=2608880 RepID=UPI00129B6F2C|nr:carboxypeptidase-like regulatory domain-containing protein [Foetidibacter luteolus]